MPEIAGHELPTPGNADSPKQRKHREQAIVIGTLVLIVLTYMLVVRNGSNASPGDGGLLSDASGFQPSDAGAGGGDQSALPGMIGGIPGQVAALEQGNTNATRKAITRLRKRARNTSKTMSKMKKNNHRQTKEIHHLQQQVHHLKAPKHPIHVTHRTPHNHTSHPPTHGGGKKASGPIPFGALHH